MSSTATVWRVPAATDVTFTPSSAHDARRERGPPVAVAELPVRPGAPGVHAPGAVHRRGVRRPRADLHHVHALQRRHRRGDGCPIRVGHVRREPRPVAQLADVPPPERVHAPADRARNLVERRLAHNRGVGREPRVRRALGARDAARLARARARDASVASASLPGGGPSEMATVYLAAAATNRNLTPIFKSASRRAVPAVSAPGRSARGFMTRPTAPGVSSTPYAGAPQVSHPAAPSAGF